MRQLLRFLGLLLAGAALLRPGEALAQGDAFSCDGAFYQIRQVGSTSQIFIVNRSAASYTTDPLKIMSNGTSNDLGVLINGLAYNSQDGYMYALSTPGSQGSNGYNTITLYKIGTGKTTASNGTVTYTPGIVTVGTPITIGGTALGMTVASGTFDKVGNYYFSSQNTGTGNNGPAADYNVYRMQPASGAPLAVTRLTTSNPNNYTFFDLAYNPLDNNLYGVNAIGALYKIVIDNPNNTATVTRTSAATANTAVGTAFFDVAGNMYAYSNGTVASGNTAAVAGGFYEVDLTNGAFTKISDVDPASVSDGASCINPGASIDVTKELTNVKAVDARTFDISYAVRVRNTYTAALYNVQVSDLLDGNTTTTTNVPFPTATSIVVQGGGPVVTNYDGAQLTANTAYTGLSATPSGSNVSGGSLLTGTVGLTAGQRALITYTVRVQFPSGQVPTDIRNNTAYATSTGQLASPNKGYTLTSTDVLLTPNDLVSNDASTNTNSGAFPALRTTLTNGTPVAVDTPAPTPLSFTPSISGVVFEDVNYGGGAGRSQAASQGVPRSGARVELYTVNTTTGLATYNLTTTTGTDGTYSFIKTTDGNALANGSTYAVRVVNSTVSSSRNAGNVTGLVPVQTFRTNGLTASGGYPATADGTVADPNRVGGEYPSRGDAGNGGTGTTLTTLNSALNNTAAQSLSYVSFTSNVPALSIDFGYNFDTVVNTNDVATISGTNAQGSLRQFITNANALQNSTVDSNNRTVYLIDQEPAFTGAIDPAAGVETSIFMIPDGNAHSGLTAYNATSNPGLISQLTNANQGVGGTVASITPAAALPALGGTYGAYTTISGATQTQNVGNTNNVNLGANSTVGTGTAATQLPQLNGPEVQLVGSTSVAYGLSVAATGANATITNIALYGFGNDIDSNTNGGILTQANNVTITGNVLGTGAASFASAPVANTGTLIRAFGGSNLAITGNLIGFGGGAGIQLATNGATVTGNEIRSNAQANTIYDGIDTRSSGNSITNNLLVNNGGQGYDSYNSTGSNTLTGNTFLSNGIGTSQLASQETAGARFYGTGNTFSQNVSASNYGAGVEVVSGAAAVISQNSIFNNGNVTAANNAAATGQVGIDLLGGSDNVNTGTAPYVTLNTTGNARNFPVLTSTTVSATSLVVTGYSRPGATMEFFLAQPNPTSVNTSTAVLASNFGQGRSYLATAAALTENTSADSNSGTGTYTSSTGAFNQGTDNASLFTFTIPLSGLTSAQVTALQSGTALITSTATLSNATSEFSGNLAVPVADVTTSLNGPTTLYAGQPTGTYTATFTNEGPQAATNVARTVTLPTGASLSAAQQADLISRYGLTSSNFVTTGSGTSAVTTINFGTLATLALNGTSAFTFAFTAPTTVSTALSLTATTTADSQGANAAADQAVLTLNTTAVADVTAAITASLTATTGTFTATFGNVGPQDAAGVVPTVQLPAGLVLSSTPSGWTYTASTGRLTYTAGATSFAASTPSALSVTINYPLSSAPTSPVVAVASVSTSTDEAGARANNVAQATMPTAMDLTTTLSGPTSAIIGSPLTLYVTTTNKGPNVAADATQKVSILSAATLANNIFISNGGTYSYANGVGTVTFPTLTNLPTGQTVTNSISFLAPSDSFAPSAAVSSTAAETSTTNNSASLTSIAVTTVADATNEATTIAATVGTTTTAATVVSPGSTVTYTVTATNNGPLATTNVAEQVQLLPGLSGTTLTVGTSPTVSTLANGNIQYVTSNGTSVYNPTTGVLTYYNVTNQNAGTAATITYDKLAVVVPAGIGNNGQLLAVASVTTALRDNVPSDNVASVGVRVRTAPDVTTTISGPSSTIAGLPASYVVRFLNAGAADAASVTETAQLPAGLSGVSILNADGTTASSATYSSSTGLVTFPSVQTDAAGAQQSYTLVLTAPAQAFTVTSATATATADGVLTNNSASVATSVTDNGDLAVSITGPATSVVGNAVTYVINTTNNGPTSVSNAVVKLQLPTGLTVQGSGAGGSATVSTSNGLDTYTFATIGTLVPGGSTLNYITFNMPAASAGLISGVASVSSATTDQVASNNTAAITTSVAPATTLTADMRTSVSLTTPAGAPTSVVAGTALTYTLGYRNAGDGTGTAGNPALNVVPTASLPAGLLVSDLKVGGSVGTQSGNIITFTNANVTGATYNTTTGLLTFPTIASAAVSTAANASYSVSFTAPVGSGSLVVGAQVTSSTSDNVLTNNAFFTPLTINTNYDVATALTGPLTAQPGTTNTYTVTSVNNGPSRTSTTTTQTVTLPAGLTVSNISGGGTQATSGSTTTITWTIPANQPAGAANAVANTFAVVMPAAGNLNLTATVTNANEPATNPITNASNTANNTAPLTTKQANVAPVAQNVWNTLQSGRGNTANLAAANGLPISALNATDADGSVAGYTVVTIPDASTQGKLYINNNGSYTQVTAGKTLTISEAANLTFAPVSGYAGDVAFTYTATDNGNGITDNVLSSPTATYTIVVAQDQSTTYATYNTGKGGSNPYVTGDILATTFDPNTVVYNSGGLVYNTSGVEQLTTTNGVSSASLVAGSLPTGVSLRLTTTTTVDANGNVTAILPAGQIYVSNASALPRVTSTTNYPVTVQTVDANGGVNTVTFNVTLGAYPLPVQLVTFTTQAVQNRDALLKWTTASELSNDHFDLERSLDGTSFVKIGQVQGQGSKASSTDYTFTDAGIGPKVAAGQPVYYRLKQVDTDGATSYSPVRTVAFSASPLATISLYPNPATATTGLDLSQLPASGTYQVLLLDATGREVRRATLGGGLVQSLDLHELATGTYSVLVTGQQASGAMLRQVLRLIKD